MSKEETTLKSKTYQALGTASMCWSETPKGVFDSTEAQKVGDELWESIQTEIKEVAIGFAEYELRKHKAINEQFANENIDVLTAYMADSYQQYLKSKQ